MSNFLGQPWQFFPGDAPAKIGFDSPANGHIAIQKIVWRRTDESVPTDGDRVCIKANFGRASECDLFNRVWANTENDIELELAGTGTYSDLYVTNLDSGVLEIFVE